MHLNSIIHYSAITIKLQEFYQNKFAVEFSQFNIEKCIIWSRIWRKSLIPKYLSCNNFSPFTWVMVSKLPTLFSIFKPLPLVSDNELTMKKAALINYTKEKNKTWKIDFFNNNNKISSATITNNFSDQIWKVNFEKILNYYNAHESPAKRWLCTKFLFLSDRIDFDM